MEESKDCYVDVDVLFWRRRKTEKKEENIQRRRISFFWRRRKTEKEREENILRRFPQKLSRILKSLGLETFANFCWVSIYVSENLSWIKKIWYRPSVVVTLLGIGATELWVSTSKVEFWLWKGLKALQAGCWGSNDNKSTIRHSFGTPCTIAVRL